MKDRTALKLPGRVDEYFSLETHTFSLASSDGYKALDLYKRASVGLVTRRMPCVSEREMTRFHDRMRVVGRLTGACDVASFGIDSGGTAFAVFPVFDGQPIAGELTTSAEAERRLLQSLRIMDRVHQTGLVCGDLASNSFWLDRQGNVKYVGVVGIEDGLDASEISRLSPDALSYIAPEVRRAEAPTVPSDIYSIGVIAYYLFTRKFPYSESSTTAELPSKLASNVPAWLDDVLPRCVAREALYRFSSVGQLLEAIAEARGAAHAKAMAPVPTEAPAPRSTNDGVRQIVVTQGKRMGAGSKSARSAPADDSAPAPTMGIVGYLAVGGLAAIGALFLFQQFTGPDNAPSKPGIGDVVADAVQPAVGPEVLNEEEKYYQELTASEDPLAHDVLVRKARDAKTPEGRRLAEKALFDRARRLGLMRSAEYLRTWFAGLPADKVPASYETLLRVLDPAMPDDARASTLKQLYISHPQVVLRLVAALALDTKDLEGFHDILAPLVGDLTRQADAAKRSTVSLILGTPELSSLFAEDLGKLTSTIPDDDIAWLLQQLGQRNDELTRSIANEALSRKLFSPAKNVFIELIKNRSDLPGPVMAALVRGVAGTISAGDIAAFGTWYDLDADEALFAITVDSADPIVTTSAFDTLGSKSIGDACVSGLIDWVRKGHWDDRSAFSKTIGVIALHNKFTSEEISNSLAIFERHSKNRELLRILLQCEASAVVSAVMQKFSANMDTGTLVNLLRHQEPGVRKSAVLALKGSNDVAILKMVLDAYELEKDPEVRKVYQENVGVVKDRSGG